MAAKKLFSISDSIKYGWGTFKENWQFLILVTVLIFVVTTIPTYLHDWSRDNLPAISFIFSIAGWIIQMLTSIGMLIISLKFLDNKKPEVSDIWNHYSFLLNYFLSSLIYGIFVISGLVLLIVPGVYLAIKYQYYSYYVIDKKMGPWEALKASGKLTQGIKTKLLLLDLAFLGVTLLGFLALGIGIIVASPVVSLASAYVYRKISQ